MTDTRLIIVRHGETEWNAAGRIQGHLDSPLDEEGREQAVAVARRLAPEPIDALYSSDLGRACQTAAPIAAATMLDVVTDPRLRERNLGLFQGITFDEARARHPELFARYKARDLHVDFATGESLLALRDRVAGVLAEIAGRHPGGTVVVVTHGGVLDQVYRLATGLPLEAPRDFEIENASLNHLRWDGTRLHLEHWGDVSHHAHGSEEF